MTGDIVPPPAPGRTWRSDGQALDRRSRQLVERAGALLGIDEPSFDTLAEECRRRLHAGPTAGLVELLRDLHTLGDELSARALTAQVLRLARCEQGLSRLRDITTTSGLIDGVCDELVGCLGFERTMLARVEAGMWRPWKANSSMLTEAWVAPWIEQAIPLDDLTMETRLLTERRPALITDTTVAGIATMVHAAGVTSYVVAPIVPDGRVVGFFHADHGAHGRRCDAGDRDILWAFAEGFGHIYERTALVEQMNTRAEEIRLTVAQLGKEVDDLVEADLELAPDAGGARPGADRRLASPLGVSRRLEELTQRELDVLDLVVAGARNSEIAERLVITVGTVKSHMNSILAKLGVLNRTQAIAAYYGAAQDRAAGVG